MNDAKPVPSQARPTRNRLPPTRSSITHKFEIDDLDGYIIVGLYPDGRPGEVFLKMGKEGSMIGGLLDSIGILTSIALQHGVPLERLTAKLSHVRFEPSGQTNHEHVRFAKSVVDYVFRWLELTFVESGREQDGPDGTSG
mgnify:CR=1 FL=1